MVVLLFDVNSYNANLAGPCLSESSVSSSFHNRHVQVPKVCEGLDEKCFKMIPDVYAPLVHIIPHVRAEDPPVLDTKYIGYVFKFGLA